MPDYKEGKNIYYFVREPKVMIFKQKENYEEYMNYLNFMESTAQNIQITNYCYGAVLLFDGFFNYEVPYNEKIHIRTSNLSINSIEPV